MKKPYIFFDFDGTVLNTNEIIIASWKATSMHYTGKEKTREEILRTFGETIRYTAGQWFPDVPVEESIEYYRLYQEANCDGMVKVFDGIEAVIDELRERGHRVALVTSRTRATSTAYLKQFGLYDKFDVFIACEDAVKHKPDPEPLLNAIERMERLVGHSISKDECLMIGDTQFDIGCGNNAGVEAVLVEWAHPIYEDRFEALGAKPDYRIAEPKELLEIV
ncbi:MAG: HAD-IA family hydrolase [Clostridiales bacterium]|nr:HAD-IA family hydrolase [Candidatus Crickella merdequi]